MTPPLRGILLMLRFCLTAPLLDVSAKLAADALAIACVGLFILLILGALLFGDAVGPRRIAACAVGLGGALFVIRPSLAVFGPVALWPLASAFFFALCMLVTRAIGAFMHPAAMQVHKAWTGLAICLPVPRAFDGSSIGPLGPPLHYSQIVVAVARGYLICGGFPSPLTWAGVVIITASKLLIHGERRSARARAAAP